MDSCPNACANISPIFLCDGISLIPDLKSEYSLCYTLLIPVMLALTIWQLYSQMMSSQTGTPQFAFQLLSRLVELTSKFTSSDIKRYFCTGVLHVAALGFFAGPFYVFFEGISDLFSYRAVLRNWGFGQIVAITVWLPSLASMVTDIVHGPVVGRTNQAPASIKFVHIVNPKRMSARSQPLSSAGIHGQRSTDSYQLIRVTSPSGWPASQTFRTG